MQEEKRMDDRKLFRVGALGAIVAAVCCFTPLLVVLFGAAGLGAALGWLDFVILPALVVFLGVMLAAVLRLRKARAEE